MDDSATILAERLMHIHARLVRAAQRTGRDPAAVRLIAVSKTHPPDTIRAAVTAGADAFGENRVQEADAKMAALADLRPTITWHLIGHLQRNKARRAVQLFDLIHSVDSLRLAEDLDRHMAALRPDARLDMLVQVNVSGEASKEGFDLVGWEQTPQRLDAFCAAIEGMLALPHIRVCGLMTIAPWGTDPEAARPVFRSTRRLRDTLAQRFPHAAWHELSMGMTDDFEIAIEEGATLVRIGRAIFGARE